MAHDDAGLRWVFGTGHRPDQDPLVGFPPPRVAELVRAAAGLPDLEVRLHPPIPGTNLKVLGFSIGAQLAHSYRTGQVFLVGDAARIVPLTGGLGGSTGIQDAHNLAWKLAAVLDGQAGPGLLDSYHDERHQVGRLVLERVPASRHRPVPGGRQRQGVLAAMPPGRPGGMLGVKDVRMHRNQTRR